MGYVFNFEKLESWQLSQQLALDIYEAVKKFPTEEKYGLVSQIRRAAISISSNLAEGSSRSTYQDRARFYQIAYGSLMEVACQLMIARSLKYIPESDFNGLRGKLEKLSNKINSLRKSQTERIYQR